MRTLSRMAGKRWLEHLFLFLFEARESSGVGFASLRLPSQQGYRHGGYYERWEWLLLL